MCNRSITILVLFIAAVLGIKLVSTYLWLSSMPAPYQITSVGARTPEEYMLLGRKINLNTTSREFLIALPGIGPKLADRIIRTRVEIGGFKSPEDVVKVKGIGQGKLRKIRHFIDVR